MCLLLIAVEIVPRWPLLLLGNRDEFYSRPSTAAAVWSNSTDVIGGRDLEAGGSWLAIHRSGRFAAVTNVRLSDSKRGPLSRGELVGQFVLGDTTPAAYVAELAARVANYAPFNLIVGDAHEIWCFESLCKYAQPLPAGIHVVSNGPIDAPWPKMQRLRRNFEAALAAGHANEAALLDLLADETIAIAKPLNTGIDRERERFLSPIFVRGEVYGTRASTLAWRDTGGGIGLRERCFGLGGVPFGDGRQTLG